MDALALFLIRLASAIFMTLFAIAHLPGHYGNNEQEQKMFFIFAIIYFVLFLFATFSMQIKI